MEFQAGIGCRYPLFCDIVGPLLGVIFLGLIVWFIISLILSNRQPKHPIKKSTKTHIRTDTETKTNTRRDKLSQHVTKPPKKP